MSREMHKRRWSLMMEWVELAESDASAEPAAECDSYRKPAAEAFAGHAAARSPGGSARASGVKSLTARFVLRQWSRSGFCR